MTRVVWSPQVIEDVEAIRVHVARDSVHYAGLLVEGASSSPAWRVLAGIPSAAPIRALLALTPVALVDFFAPLTSVGCFPP